MLQFLHIDFSMQDGEILSVIGVRMLSPINANNQTPSLRRYLLKLTSPFLCTGDFNIMDYRMSKWFPGVAIESIVNTNYSLSDSSIIYIDKNSNEVTGYGAVDHVLHSDNIKVNSEYNWNFLLCDPIYPCVDNICIGTIWNIPPAYHALMISDMEMNPL